jgi:hypothetical protein
MKLALEEQTTDLLDGIEIVVKDRWNSSRWEGFVFSISTAFSVCLVFLPKTRQVNLNTLVLL